MRAFYKKEGKQGKIENLTSIFDVNWIIINGMVFLCGKKSMSIDEINSVKHIEKAGAKCQQNKKSIFRNYL